MRARARRRAISESTHESAHMGSQSAVHALRGSHSAVPATKISTSRSIKCFVCHESVLQGSQSAVPVLKPALRFTEPCACHEICTSRFTWRSPASAFRNKQLFQRQHRSRCQNAAFARYPPNSENEPHVQSSWFIYCICHEIKAM